MGTTLIIWAIVLVIIVIVGFMIEGDKIMGGCIFLCLFLAGIIFGIFGSISSNSVKFAQPVSNFDAKEYPDFVLISTPEGETLKITTLADKTFFETNKGVYRIWKTNHYNSPMNNGLSIRP